ncbi:MAG TPA: sugar phosphate isomerase/epimerase family protein [Planctomycetaceae bacterium]|jgi:sugar phosphate isomerase/epimerase|nr:sugar phosphate isomerase/epimerase family protein [Planctomycetaceae bacterium]
MSKPLRLALATRCLSQPLKPALMVASQLGATGVQLDARNEAKPSEMSGTGRRQFAHLLAEIGLQLASLDFPLRRPLWDAERLDARVEALKQTMEFAYELKARTVTVRLGGLPQETDVAGQSLLKGVLDDLARHGNHVGVTVAVGPGREPAARLLEVVGAVGEGPIGVNFDPATAVTSGASPAESLETLRKFVTHVMIRDAIRDSDGGGNEVPVGRGDVPWDEILAILQGTSYGGWLTVDRTQGEDRAGDGGRAIQYLQSVYRG